MPTDWRTPYAAALREIDPAKLLDACETARRAIYTRLMEVQHESPGRTAEVEELEEALRQLFLHFNKQKRKPEPGTIQ